MVKSDDKQARIIAAALPLFVEQGLRRTTVEQIARTAKIGKGTVYLYFATKQAIFAAIGRREAQVVFRKMRSAVRREESAVEQLRAVLRARVKSVSDLLVTYKVGQELILEVAPLIRELEREFGQTEGNIIEGVLEAGVESGEFAVDDIPQAALAISAAIRSLERPWWFAGRELGVDRKLDLLVDLFLDGLRSRARTRRRGGQRNAT